MPLNLKIIFSDRHSDQIVDNVVAKPFFSQNRFKTRFQIRVWIRNSDFEIGFEIWNPLFKLDFNFSWNRVLKMFKQLNSYKYIRWKVPLTDGPAMASTAPNGPDSPRRLPTLILILTIFYSKICNFYRKIFIFQWLKNKLHFKIILVKII